MSTSSANKDPINVGLIGLSATYAWANDTHLPALQSSPHFSLVALSGRKSSTVEAAKKKHNLPESTALYTSAAELAADPNVHLAVISTNITTHYDLAKPIIEAGKDIYVEWPLASTVAEAEELANLAREKGIKTAVGLQGRFEETVDVVKRVVEEEKRIGDVLSVRVEASTGMWGANVPALHKYTVDGHSGGTFTTIYSGHLMDLLQCAHGEIKSFQSVLAKQRDTVDVLSDNGEVVEAAAKRTTADHLSLHGVFENGALFDFAFRTGEPFDGTGLRWNIYGTKGEIEITCPTTMPLNMSIATSFKVKGADGKVEDIKLQGGGPSVNVGKIYEGIRTGDKRIVSFDEAVRRQKFLEKLGAYTDTKLTFARDNVGSN